MEVSWKGGTPKSSILTGFSIVNHPAMSGPASLGAGAPGAFSSCRLGNVGQASGIRVINGYN